MGEESEGAFTFQAALYKTGDITFSYREVGRASALCTCGSFLLDATRVTLLLACLRPDASDVRRDEFS